MHIATGDLLLFSGDLIPEGFAACDGSLLRISYYPTLFNLLGTTHGGDGLKDFGVPELPITNGIYLICLGDQDPAVLEPTLAPVLEMPARQPSYLHHSHGHAA